MEYSGTDNLEVMTVAKNYNSHIVGEILACSPKAQDILDFGAGLGLYAQSLKDKNLKVKCFEIDEKLIGRLRSKGFDVFSKLENIKPSSLDLIYSANVLEHIQDDQEILEQFFMWLKPGGKLFLYVPAFMHLYSSMDKKVGHFRRYNKTELLEKTTAVGFVPLKCHYVDSLGYLATVAFKIVGNKRGDISERSIKTYDSYFFPLSLGLDQIAKNVFGKNLLFVATKPAAP